MAFSTTVAQRGINSPFESIIQTASARYGVPTSLIKAIISQESGWDPGAVNPNDPSYGLMQLNFNYFKTASGQPITDPAENIDRGTQFLSQQISRYSGNVEQAVSAYNAGHYITGNYSGYVVPVMQYRDWFVANDGGGDGGTIEPPPPDGGVDITDSDIKLIAGLTVAALLVFALLRR